MGIGSRNSGDGCVSAVSRLPEIPLACTRHSCQTWTIGVQSPHHAALCSVRRRIGALRRVRRTTRPGRAHPIATYDDAHTDEHGREYGSAAASAADAHTAIALPADD